MVKIPQADFHQLCQDALFWYKKDVIRVCGLDGGEISIFYLKNRKTILIPYAEHEKFTPVIERIGMVNIRKSCVFVSRTTARQYLVGVASSNVQINHLPVDYPLDVRRTLDEVKGFKSPELIAAINNDYPPLPEAYKKAVEWVGACAFDKQFAIDSKGNVFFKTKAVAVYKDDVLVYKKGFEHLGCLLENCYEKTSRTFKGTPIRG